MPGVGFGEEKGRRGESGTYGTDARRTTTASESVRSQSPSSSPARAASEREEVEADSSKLDPEHDEERPSVGKRRCRVGLRLFTGWQQTVLRVAQNERKSCIPPSSSSKRSAACPVRGRPAATEQQGIQTDSISRGRPRDAALQRINESEGSGGRMRGERTTRRRLSWEAGVFLSLDRATRGSWLLLPTCSCLYDHPYGRLCRRHDQLALLARPPFSASSASLADKAHLKRPR